MEVLIEEYGRMDGWVFQLKGGERTKIQDVEKSFQDALWEVLESEVGFIQSCFRSFIDY